MRIRDIIAVMDEWAPGWTAWERDNVGLQVGDPDRSVRRILVALDVTAPVIEEAVRRKADLIVSHHPLLFRPPSSITANDEVGRLVLMLAEHRIALFSAHTNLDFARGGVSMTLAERLGLQSIRFLAPLNSLMAKVAVFVPEGHLERVHTAMAEAGAGVIGEYSSCAFSAAGRGSFCGSERSRPFLGTPGSLEHADEHRLEMIVPRAGVDRVIRAMKAVHPYEEAAFDVYHIENPTTTSGMGAIGELPSAEPKEKFLRRIRQKLNAGSLRYTASPASNIRTVAVCSGAGSDLLPNALRAGAEAFITADVRYHTFHSATGQILLVDAGHWETENVVVPVIAARLSAAAASSKASLHVSISQQSTNPVRSTVRASA